MYEKTTFGISVTSTPVFIPEQSSPLNGYFVWLYTIRIVNNSENEVQLLNRHWRITDAFGNLEEVKGPGVIGEQPVLSPGDSYEYSSGTNLRTSSGIMQGSYQFQNLDKKEEFLEVEIPAFSLDSPFTQGVIN